MIYSKDAIDYEAGFDLVETPCGIIMKPRKIGCYVLTIEELRQIIKERNSKGDET